MDDDGAGVARMPSKSNDDDNLASSSFKPVPPVAPVSPGSSWEGRIMMRMEEQYGGKVLEQDIMSWTKPQFKKMTVFFSPDYKPSDPDGWTKLRDEMRSSSILGGFNIVSKGKRGKGNLTELMVCSRARKDLLRTKGKRKRTSKGCCSFRLGIHKNITYDRYYLKGGTGDPRHTFHGCDCIESKVGKTERSVNRDSYWPPLQVSRQLRWKDHSGAVIWLTGLSGSGKTTIANETEYILHQKKGMRTYTLDSDEVRRGLSSDLGLDLMGRKENIRRVGEVAKLMAEAGNVVLCAFVSPYQADREFVRLLCGAVGIPFSEVYVKADLEVCERRDTKGLYVKARAGLIQGLSGVDVPYEEPLTPDFVLESGASFARARDLARSLVSWLEANVLATYTADTKCSATNNNTRES